MSNEGAVQGNGLAATLMRTWEAQGQQGFLLTDPAVVDIPTREAVDQANGVAYRFRWMPHRELRGNVTELERRGILNPDRDERALFRDPRDSAGRHCFLCEGNIAECHPMETLVPIDLAGRRYLAGANFAWIERDHFTVMAGEHVDQTYSRHVLEAIVDLHEKAGGQFRILYNGVGAGATIPWHLHLQITTAAMPIERLTPDHVDTYPTTVRRFEMTHDSLEDAHAAAQEWLDCDTGNHSLNLLAATVEEVPTLFLFPRDQRRATANGKGLVGGFEVAGDFVLSAPHEEGTFQDSSPEAARAILRQIRPQA